MQVPTVAATATEELRKILRLAGRRADNYVGEPPL